MPVELRKEFSVTYVYNNRLWVEMYPKRRPINSQKLMNSRVAEVQDRTSPLRYSPSTCGFKSLAKPHLLETAFSRIAFNQVLSIPVSFDADRLFFRLPSSYNILIVSLIQDKAGNDVSSTQICLAQQHRD